jgi:transcriptional regulator
MYVPQAFAMSAENAVDALQNIGAGYFVTEHHGQIDATFLPFFVHADDSPIRIWAHFAKANSHWKSALAAQQCLLIAHLADAYVSPSLYPSKQIDEKVVPTWNYVTVEVRGTLQPLDDLGEAQLLQMLTETHERASENPWAVAEAPADFIAAQRRAIVSVELVVSEITGKAKASQNRRAEDAAAVKSAFEEGSDAQRNIAQWINSHDDPI